MFTNVLKKFFTGAPQVWEQSSNRTEEEHQMAEQIKTALHRSRDTIVADALGVAALMVLLIVGLALPGLV